MSEKKVIFKPGVNSVRFTDQDCEFLNQEALPVVEHECEKEITPRIFMMTMAEISVSKRKFIDKPVTDPQQAAEIDRLTRELTELRQTNNELESINSALLTENAEFQKLKKVTEDYLIMCKHEKLAQDHAEMFDLLIKIAQSHHGRYFIITDSDIEIIKQYKNG